MNQEHFHFEDKISCQGELRPTFLCIGQPHSGSTWLHGALSMHPQIRLPRAKKDVDYFCFNYHLGEKWYLEHFCSEAGEDGVLQVGEVGPMYLYGDLAPQRIAAFQSIRKLIVMLRDPMSWFVSHYHATHKGSPYTRDRSLYLKHHGSEFALAGVHSYLSNYFSLFDREDFLFITMDELAADSEAVKVRLAAFLEVEVDGFREGVPNVLYNQARQPRLKPLYVAARHFRDRHFREFEWITSVESRVPFLTRFLFQDPEPPPTWLLDELRARKDVINRETKLLGDAIDRDLSSWMIE